MDRPVRDRKPTSWTARVFAPLLLVVVAGAVILVISGSLGDDDDSSDRPDRRQTTAASCTPSEPDAVENGYYVVTAEDTAGLTGIADKTCISVAELERLNPNLDAQTLQVSNCVDLVKDGCRKLASG